MPELKLPVHCMDSKLLSKAKEVKATADKKELSQLLTTGKWKAVCESPDGKFILIRIS